MKMNKYFAVVSVGLLVIAPCHAKDSPKEACKNAVELYEDDDLTGAVEEAQWCLDLLKQEQAARVVAIFPDSINGFVGDKLESQNAMGFSSSKRNYNKGGKQVSVTLSGTSGGVMSAFSSLAQLGMSAGMGEKMRIQKRTAMVMPEGNNMRIMVTLKNGGMLMFESNDVSKDELVEFANAFPVAELDDSRS